MSILDPITIRLILHQVNQAPNPEEKFERIAIFLGFKVSHLKHLIQRSKPEIINIHEVKSWKN